MRRVLTILAVVMIWLQSLTGIVGALECDPDNGGLSLPPGFCALVVADDLGRARHLAVRSNGDIYVLLRHAYFSGAVVALRDANGDGRAEIIKRFGPGGGTGVAISGDELYLGATDRILKYSLGDRNLVPEGEAQTVVAGFPSQMQHKAKSLTLDGQGGLYVNVGAPSNACQQVDRVAGSAGEDPCTQLLRQGGIWRFDAGALGLNQSDGIRYATGIRNAVALEWNPDADKLYAVQHGRDQLSALWPSLYNEHLSAEVPAEEFFRVEKGSDFGWPYCYYDPILKKKLLAPEYGGDGKKVGRCQQAQDPIVAFPGHWAPNDLIFYQGGQYPKSYEGGAFIAFHGSWNRAPLPQQGYKVVFVPFIGQQPGSWEVFAEGFAGAPQVESPGDALYRPMGLAEGPDGSLYVVDSVQGRLWRILYRPGG